MRWPRVVLTGVAIFLVCQAILLRAFLANHASPSVVRTFEVARIPPLALEDVAQLIKSAGRGQGRRTPPPRPVAPGAQRLRDALVAAEHRWVHSDATSTLVFPPGNEDGECVGRGPPRVGAYSAVVMVAFDRPEYMQHAMLSMLEVHGLDSENGLRYPLYISQDFDHPGVQEVVEPYLGRVRYIQHRETKVPVPDSKREKVAYYRIANHYRFIFRTFFECFGFPRLVILEDDMVVSPDIFSYFHAAGRLLDEDPTLFCVSSWNDHGQSQFVRDTHALHRTDFFPGLGWLTTAPVWRSIEDSWHRAYWDDWMRLNATRRGRQCIRPEVSRTHNFGKVGASGGQFFDTYLKTTALSNESINWDAADLSYLLSDRYAAAVAATVRVAPELPAGDAWDATTGPVKVMYSSQEQYQAITGQYGMMREWKESVPRGAYQGIVRVRNPKGSEVLITPIPGLNLTTVTLTVGNDTFLDASGAVIPKRMARIRQQLKMGTQ